MNTADGTNLTPDGDAPIERPWWKKKRFAIPLGSVASLALLGALIDNPDEDAISIGAPETTLEAPTTTAAVTTSSIAAETSTTERPSTTTTSTTTSTTTTTVLATTTSTAPPPTIAPTVADGRAQLDALIVGDPDPAREPYERDRYDGDGWEDADGDCLSTRHELLLGLSTTPAALVADGCRVESGSWTDPYTGEVFTLATEVSIDHLVPLAAAHRAGSWTWDDATKRRFANDERPGHLVVTGLDSNQAKADKTPDDWLPPQSSAHCQYALDWIATKRLYELTVTASEKAALSGALDTCAPTSTVRPAVDIAAPVVVVTTPTTTTTTTITPSAGPGVVELLSCNKRSETVTIANTGGASMSLSGFLLHDEGNKHSVALDRFGSLDPGQQLRILTGPDAADGDGQVVWKNQNVWNNDGDTAHLIGFGVEQTVRC